MVTLRGGQDEPPCYPTLLGFLIGLLQIGWTKGNGSAGGFKGCQWSNIQNESDSIYGTVIEEITA